MPSDPRCPHCSEKVSATATWCMHCGRDFDQPVEADGGRPVGSGRGETTDVAAALESGDIDGLRHALERSDTGMTTVGIAYAVIALVTLPFVAPGGVTLLYLVAVAAVGYVAADQRSLSTAIERGGQALAAAPFLLWLVAGLFGSAAVSATALLGPVVYAGLVLYGIRALGGR